MFNILTPKVLSVLSTFTPLSLIYNISHNKLRTFDRNGQMSNTASSLNVAAHLVGAFQTD